jgi:hypothetical protein
LGKNRRKIMLKKEIDGVTYVYVPKDMWDRIWEILDRIDEIVSKYDQHS